MFYINDDYYDEEYLKSKFELFEKTTALRECKGKRFTVCFDDAALWLALCFYLKENQASVFPLSADTPLYTAKLRAKKSESHYFLWVRDGGEIEFTDLESEKLNYQAGLVQMSSGTTGEPKIISRTWISIEKEIDAYIQHFPEANDMTPVVAAPITHSYGLI